jgi:hypothetical protein
MLAPNPYNALKLRRKRDSSASVFPSANKILCRLEQAMTCRRQPATSLVSIEQSHAKKVFKLFDALGNRRGACVNFPSSGQKAAGCGSRKKRSCRRYVHNSAYQNPAF